MLSFGELPKCYPMIKVGYFIWISLELQFLKPYSRQRGFF